MSNAQRTTRSTNKDKHPGLPDVDEETLAKPIPKPRRTRVQILADAAATQQKKDKRFEEQQQEAARKAAGIKEIAKLENRMRADTARSSLNAAHPPATSQIRKVPRPLVLKPTGIEADEHDSDSDNADADEDGELLSVVSSRSAFSKSRTASSAPSSRAADSDLEMDSDNADGKMNSMPKTKVAGKAKAPSAKTNRNEKASVRSVINKHAITSDFSEQVDVNTGAGKRKAPANPLLDDLSSSERAKRIKPSRVPLPGSKAVTPSERNSSPAASVLSVADDGASTTDDVRSNFDYGGYPDEEDSIQEKAALPTGVPAKPRHINLKSIVHIHRPGKAEVALANASRSAVEAKPRVKFTNYDLPQGVHSTWTKTFVPRWLQLVGTYRNPWVLNSGVDDAQGLWDAVFPERAGLDVIKSSGEPIFSVLKQRTYEWRGGFLLSAAAAVNAFWETDPIYTDPINRSAYIEWGIPTDIDEPTPITWANVDESDPDHIVYQGAFLSAPVIATFAHHLAVLDTIPAGDRILAHAEGALALSATAVEHAFRRWSTGEYEKKFEGFAAALADKTATYLADIEGISEKGWGKIMAAARIVINEKPGSAGKAEGGSAKPSHASLRRRIVDADDD